MKDRRGRRDVRAAVGSVAGWVVPHRAWEARRRWQQLHGGGCSHRRSLRLALSGKKTNALVNTRLELLPGRALDRLGTVVDVGANVGDWTAGVLAVTEPRQVIAFEPSPLVFPVVRERFADHPEVMVIQAAVGDDDGSTPFYLTDHSHNASALRPREDFEDIVDRGGHVRERVDVEMVCLDTALAQCDRIDLLKIDVQGFERSVLAGADATLAKTTWALVEANFVNLYEGDLLLPELHGVMVDAGFALANISRPYVRNGRALFADALYRRD